MHVEVNGTRQWFDVDGAALVPWPLLTGFVSTIRTP